MFVVKIAMSELSSVGTAEYAVPTELTAFFTCCYKHAAPMELNHLYKLEVKKSEKHKNTRDRID
jgi:hypothetical protein